MRDAADSPFSQPALTMTAQDDQFHFLTLSKFCDRFSRQSFQDDLPLSANPNFEVDHQFFQDTALLQFY